ncbi:MAG: hypothetical protein EP329_20050 [Deltaproteobacteria bacterium]|nr:MAG: hypothetical protein EP329_20050 [Deltaproteobacteria bacterium]
MRLGGVHTLGLMRCGDAACTSFDAYDPDPTDTLAASFDGIGLGADGIPVVAYRDGTAGKLKIARVPLGRGTLRR